MFNISNFLQKFSKNIIHSEIEKGIIIESVKKNAGITLELSQVEIKNYIAYIYASPALKNKLFISKQLILDDIKSNTPSKIVDIK